MDAIHLKEYKYIEVITILRPNNWTLQVNLLNHRIELCRRSSTIANALKRIKNKDMEQTKKYRPRFSLLSLQDFAFVSPLLTLRRA